MATFLQERKINMKIEKYKNFGNRKIIAEKGGKLLLSCLRERSEIQYEERVPEFPGEGVATGYSLQRRDKKPLPMSGEVGICHLRQQMAKIPGEGNIPQGMDLFAPSPEAVRLINSPTASTLSRHWERIEVSRLAKCAFTLAEVLITLGVIGVVAAVTLPTLLTNIQDRVRQEQVRTVKYKFTKATDKMNSLGRITEYPTTMDFVNELKKHMTIAKVCDSSKLNECWPAKTITAYSGNSTTPQTVNVNTITNGTELKALANTTGPTATVGIVTGDGVPMILVYNTHCSGFDETKQYTWSVENGKPVTNATTNCVSAIFDINGAKGPNKIGTDVRTLNSIFGAAKLTGYAPADMAICKNMKKKYGFQYCGTHAEQNKDNWVGAMYACDKLGLHLPSIQTLASMANARYGTNIITPFTAYIASNPPEGQTCLEYFKTSGKWTDVDYREKYSDKILCSQSGAVGAGSPLANSFDGTIWSNSEVSTELAYVRYITSDHSIWYRNSRENTFIALCVGD